MEIDDRITCFNTKNKIMICFVLKSHKLSITEIVAKIKTEFDIESNRETIYRSIESLKRCGIVEKKYIAEEKRVRYFLNISKVEIDFIKREISFQSN